LWDLFIPADLEQQKVCDAYLLMMLPVLFISFPDKSFDIAIRVLTVPAFLFQAIATRPLQWMRPSSRLVVWFGRLLFAGLAILVVRPVLSF
jgi:hypothetical protein